MQYLRDLLVPVFLLLETEEVFLLLLLQHFAADVRSSPTEQSSLTTPVSENCCTNEPWAYTQHSSASNSVWKLHNHFHPGGSTGQDLHSPSEWVRFSLEIMWCCHLLGSSCGVSINLFSDTQIGSSVANRWWRLPLQPLCERMYSRSSGENVFRAFIPTSSNWLPLQLHMLALALQRPLLVTDHFDWSMNSSWGIGRNSCTLVPKALVCFTWADVRSC